ncbi:MAG: cytochrome c peroxidase [Syntrophobacteraceae bacterium]
MKSRLRLTLSGLGLGLLGAAAAMAQEGIPFVSLREVPVPVPMAVVVPAPIENIPGPGTPLTFQDLIAAGIVKDQPALIRLGKALFWDMQVGSDGVQACATCHFNAGADVRSRNSISPGVLDTNFTLGPIGGDNAFGNSTVPFTANDPNNPFGPVDPPDPGFEVPGLPQFMPNYDLTREDFPLNGWFNPTSRVPRGLGVTFLEEMDNIDQDTNDVISSMGVRRTQFVGVTPGKAVDQGTPLPDVFNLANPGQLDVNSRMRRVEPRNAPTTLNGIFNFDTFWDGRASFIFNGVNPFGFRDRASTLKQNVGGVLTDVFIRVTNSSLASQSVGPPLSDFEMSWAGRSFPDLGKKMVSLKPLAKQLVHPQDSVLGPMSLGRASRTGRVSGRKGLNAPTYTEMIQAAFHEQWWNSPDVITVDVTTAAVQKASARDPRAMVLSPGRTGVVKKALGAPLAANQYTQMMFNFSLFWGLAVQAYEATLISDDTPFDRYMGTPSLGIPGDPTALTDQEVLGLSIFMGSGKCNNCHVTPVTTGHTVLDVQPDSQGVPLGQGGIIELMVMGDGQLANYDHGMYNISVRRTTEDLGRAGTAPNAAPFLNPLDSNNPFPLSYVDLVALRNNNQLPGDVARFVPDTPLVDRRVSRGAFKASNLRNVLHTGPYFHNGDSATLRQVVEFYVRGGNFPNSNFQDLTVDIDGIFELMFPEFLPDARQNVEALVALLANGFTDQRVALEKAPFDHPQLAIPNGVRPGSVRNAAKDVMLQLPAVGQGGRATPIPRFLGLDPQDSGP